LLDLADCKTAKAFFERVKYVPISLDGDLIIFYPTDNKGMKDGFKNTKYPNLELNYSDASNEELGKALLSAFEMSSII